MEKLQGRILRLHLDFEAAKPPWGTFNVTGNVKAWSFTDSLQKSDGQVCKCSLGTRVCIKAALEWSTSAESTKQRLLRSLFNIFGVAPFPSQSRAFQCLSMTDSMMECVH